MRVLIRTCFLAIARISLEERGLEAAFAGEAAAAFLEGAEALDFLSAFLSAALAIASEAGKRKGEEDESGRSKSS